MGSAELSRWDSGLVRNQSSATIRIAPGAEGFMQNKNELGQLIGFLVEGWRGAAPPEHVTIEGERCRLESLEATRLAGLDLCAIGLDTLRQRIKGSLEPVEVIVPRTLNKFRHAELR